MSMAIDPINKGVMYVTGGSEGGSAGLYKSTNGGVDWEQLLDPATSELGTHAPPGVVSSVAMEAKNPLHLVVSMHSTCQAPYGKVCEAETTDGGKTWAITSVPVNTDQWVAGAGAFILDANTWLFATYGMGLFLTRDRGANWTVVTAKDAYGATAGKTLTFPFAPTPSGDYFLPTYQGITMSKNGVDWQLLPASGGLSASLVTGDGQVFTADPTAPKYHRASEAELAKWSSIDPPAGIDHGALWLAYDEGHHILYSSNWSGGLWRMVMK
jgi:hypothetical protein